MSEPTPPQKDDGVDVYSADARDLASYSQAQRQLAQLRAPILVDAKDPHQRMFVAVLDGTGNNMFKDDDTHETGIVRIYKQIEAQHAAGKLQNIGAGYVTGIGTQDSGATWDGIKGHTFEERTETMYKQFIEYSARELARDPNAKISVAAMGFSRGAEEAAYFTRLVDERGIQDPTGAKYTYDDNGLVASVSYSKPPLVAPGTIAQAVLLQDPVATGNPLDYDRRLPPSVISGVQVTAEDERRDQFLSTPHLRPGLTEHNRFLNVTVGGAHSDIGDSYTANGLGIRSTNFAVDYLNSLSATPFLSKRAEPSDPSVNVVHRSEQHQWVYTTDTFDAKGSRGFNYDLAPPEREWYGARKAGQTNQVKETMDANLAGEYPARNVPITPAPTAPDRRTGFNLQETPVTPGLGLSKPEEALAAKAAPTLLDQSHPGNGLYRQALDGMRNSPEISRTLDGDQQSRAAAALVERAVQGPDPLNRIDGVMLNRQGDSLIAIQGSPTDPSNKLMALPLDQAVNASLPEASKRVDLALQEHSRTNAQLPSQDVAQHGPKFSAAI